MKMGLDSFKTEGPRTRKPNKDTMREKGQIVHFLEGTSPDISNIPTIYERHKVEVNQELIAMKIPGEPPYFVCPKCGRASTSFEKMVKIDKQKNMDKDWADEIFGNVIEAFEQVDIDEIMLDLEDPLQSEDEDEEEDTGPSTGLESFMT